MPLATPVVLPLEETFKAEHFPPDSKLVKQATPYFMDDRKVLGATTLTRIEVKVVNGEP